MSGPAHTDKAIAQAAGARDGAANVQQIPEAGQVDHGNHRDDGQAADQAKHPETPADARIDTASNPPRE